MAATVTAFRIVFPELAAMTDAQVEMALEWAQERVSLDCFAIPSQVDEAAMNFAAHVLTMQRVVGAGSGVLQSESIGPMSRSYSVPTPPSVKDCDDYYLTPYGRRYRKLLELNSPAVLVV